ncbi:Zn-dependent exopeptidase [Auricularia subglabra TFB-10046 SS5]|nr:Zn-dependent exopeptidase [Auricularia subglabra TFB-10046 SS5]
MLPTTLLCLAASALALPSQLVFNDDATNFLNQFDQTGFSLDLNERRLVQFEGREPIRAKMAGMRFFDVTDTPDLEANAHLTAFTKEKGFPKPNQTEFVEQVLETLTIDGPVENLQKFSSFRTRHYLSDYTQEYASPRLLSVITVEEFPHPWNQNSIIARINGSERDDVVIVSAHLDSTNTIPFLPAPGADDDGSGTVTILEAYRGLLLADFQPTKTLEFHWYAAEEGGHLGSQAVAQDYQQRSMPVYAQTQFDMTAWIKAGTREEVGIVTDLVDPELAQFLREIVDKYIDIPYADTLCGYACSDHASWNKAGYRSSYLFEGQFTRGNRHAHSIDDRIDISPEFSFDHMLHFIKIAAALAIELAGQK